VAEDGRLALLVRGGMSMSGSGTIELVPITDDDVKAVCDLAVAPDQAHLVAANVWSLAQAYADREHAWPRAFVRDGQVVGFGDARGRP
jgi:hypothetical protein